MVDLYIKTKTHIDMYIYRDVSAKSSINITHRKGVSISDTSTLA